MPTNRMQNNTGDVLFQREPLTAIVDELFNMDPVKAFPETNLPPSGGLFLLTDADGIQHVSACKNIRNLATRMCSSNKKSHLANGITLRRTRKRTESRPNSMDSVKNLCRHNKDFKSAREQVLAELMLSDIRFIVVEDETMRGILKNLVCKRLKETEQARKDAERRRSILEELMSLSETDRNRALRHWYN